MTGTIATDVGPAGFEVRLLREEERQRMRALTAQAFALPEHRFAMHMSTPLEEVRVLAVNGNLQGLLRVERIGQFFGRQSIPSAAISLVLVAVEGRGRGLGKLLVREVLSELRRDGVALSTLYPAGVGLYRCLGYEFAGAWTRYQLPMSAIPRKRGFGEVEPWDEDSLGEIMACYQGQAVLGSGLCDRTERWWRRRVVGCAGDPPVYRWLVRRDGVVSGYAIYTQEPQLSGSSYAYSLVCRDLVWHDAEAARALLRAAGSHHGLGLTFSWPGPIEEPLYGFIDAEEIKVQDSAHWMTRLVDVRRALELRAYPPELEASVELVVVDGVLPDNQGPIRLQVSGGHARISHARDATMSVDVGALAAMYTGWWPAREAARAGRLVQATSEQIRTLEQIFSGPTPWMLDRF